MRLDQAARRLLDLLDPESMLIGGLCAAMHGVERFTRDVDIASGLQPEEILRRLKKAGIKADIRTNHDPGDLAWVITGEIGDIEFQILPTADTGLRNAKIEIHASLRTPDVISFIRSKCLAGGQQDMHDVAALCLMHPQLLETALELAEAHGCGKALENWLNDARLQRRYTPSGKPTD